MVKAFAQTKLNGGAIVLGLSDENIQQLMAGGVIIVEIKTIPGTPKDQPFSCVALVAGDTEESILQSFGDNITPHTFKILK